VAAIDAAACIGPMHRRNRPTATDEKKVFSVLLVISLVGTISRKSLKLLRPDVIFLKLKCTKFDIGCGSAPDRAGRSCSAPSDPLAGCKGPTSKGMEERKDGREEQGRERKG